MSTSRKPWDIRDGERTMWYDRFTVYRNLGPARTIEETFRRCEEIRARGGNPVRDGKRPSRHWYRISARDEWELRALAWDAQRQIDEERDAKRSLARVKDDLWDIYESGLVKLRQGLSMPLVRSRTMREELLDDGRTVKQEITVEPMPGVNMSALSSFMSQVVRAAQLVGGIDDVEKLSSVTPERLRSMTDEELSELHEMLAPVVERTGSRRDVN